MIIEEEVYLAHHGVRGMKWGVRRARRNERLAEAGVKGGSKAAKVRALARLGPVDLVKGRGITGGAARKAARIQARTERVKSGKAHVASKLVYYGSTHVSDLIPVKSKNVGKKTVMDNHKLVLAGAGALFAAKVLARHAQVNANL